MGVEEQCHFFTYHWSNASTFPDTCFLLTEILEPITVCSDNSCISGSNNCAYSLCGFLNAGTLHPDGLIVEDTKEIGMLLMGPCASPDVLTVAVGGGGLNPNKHYSGGGSGSSYIEFDQLSITSPFMNFEAQVGSAGQVSRV